VKLEGSDWQRSFEIDPFVKHRLLNGLDDIGITMQYEDEISNYESSRSSKKPDTSSAFEDTMKVG
jgi:3-isopropylmalate/(R)-2-methylmalate dehydratase small subunit